MDELVDTVKNLTIDDAKYYESSTTTASDTQGDLTRNPETVTHTINGNETGTNTSNGNSEKILSNRDIPVLPPSMNPGIDQGIAPIILAPQTLFFPEIKEVVTDAASVGSWVNNTMRQVIQTVVDRSTPGDICNAVRVVETPSPVLIGIFATSPPCGLDAIQQVINKR